MYIKGVRGRSPRKFLLILWDRQRSQGSIFRRGPGVYSVLGSPSIPKYVFFTKILIILMVRLVTWVGLKTIGFFQNPKKPMVKLGIPIVIFIPFSWVILKKSSFLLILLGNGIFKFCVSMYYYE